MNVYDNLKSVIDFNNHKDSKLMQINNAKFIWAQFYMFAYYLYK